MPDLSVVIDAGHGGDDPGCVWPTGAATPQLREKDLVVGFADAALQTIKDNITLKCYQTRPPPDRTVPLQDRVDLANRNFQADALVSFHVNTAGSDRPQGMWVIHDDGSRRGEALALCVQKHLRVAGFTCDVVVPDGTPHVGNRQLAILSRTTMPAVLIELGFITNREDRMLLQGANDSRQKVALAVAGAIEEWAAAPNVERPVAQILADLEARVARLEFLAEV